MTVLTDEIRKRIKEQLVAKPKRKERANVKRLTNAGLWVRPFASEAISCDPSEVPRAKEILRAHGVTADFDSEGRLLATSERQFRKAAQAFGMWGGRDGYGIRNEEGQIILTGRERIKAREEWKRKVLSGEIDIFGDE